MDQLPSDFVLISLGKFATMTFGRFAIVVALPIMTLIIGWFALMLIRHQRSSHPRRQESPKGIVMPDPSLVLRRANVSRPSGAWKEEDFDVFDGERDVGRIFRINAATEIWWWGVGFQVIGRKSYGTAATLDEAKAAFKAKYERWQKSGKGG
jgi:hypothetical protein